MISEQQHLINYTTLFSCIVTFFILAYITLRALVLRDVRFAAFTTLSGVAVLWFVIGYLAVVTGTEISSPTFFRPATALLMVALAWSSYLAWHQREYVVVLEDLTARLDATMDALKESAAAMPTAFTNGKGDCRDAPPRPTSSTVTKITNV